MMHRATKRMGKDIVIVDDDAFFGKILKNYLEKHNLNTEVLTNGDALVKYLEENKPDLVILDLIMPKLDGFDTLEKIKMKELYDMSKIVVVTALSQNQDKEAVEAYGVKDYIVKGEVTIQELADRLNEHL